MTQPNRVSAGGQVDHTQVIRFKFNGQWLTGLAGDSLASALLANDIHLLARSFKFHRPRGLIGSGAEEPNVFVEVRRTARARRVLRATEVELVAGLDVRSVNCWPSPSFDVMQCIDVFHRMLQAGFYYKTFLWPAWRFFEPFIRSISGIGKAPGELDTSRYEHRNAHCDILVVGAGAAGLAAAHSAVSEGCSIILAEQRPSVAVLPVRPFETDNVPETEWSHIVSEQISANPLAKVLVNTTVCGFYEQNYLTLAEQTPNGLRLWHIRARQVILATGAIERPMVFPENDRPGIMLMSAVLDYLLRYDVRCGRKIVVFTNNDTAYDATLTLASLGVTSIDIIDSRAATDRGLLNRVKALGIRVHHGYCISRTYGQKRVCAVSISPLAGAKPSIKLECDLVAMSGGWSPAVHLFSQAGGKLRYDEDLACFIPNPSSNDPITAGAVNGHTNVRVAISEGRAAGRYAAKLCGVHVECESPGVSGKKSGSRIEAFWRVPLAIAGTRRQWVDFQNDVVASDIDLAAKENFRSVEHLKRYTTLGMAPDQGKLSNVNGLALLAGATERAIGAVGTTTFRPPYTPLSFGAIAGRHVGTLYKATKRLPTHERQLELGASMEDYSDWLRPAYYSRMGEGERDAIAREVLSVRNGVGICDYSPLGKIEVAGRDAAKFLNRMVPIDVSKLQVGQARYNVILNEKGTIIDDGIISRPDNQTFLVGTTSGAARKIASAFEEWHQCEWPDLDVFISDRTTGWGTILLSGPNARKLLSKVVTEVALDREAFPHMGVRDGLFSGTRARVLRVSYTGELSFEISVPWRETQSLWDGLIAHGKSLNITPFGLESLMVMRTEKAFVHLGSDTDGTTIPADIGLTRLVSAKSEDYIGRRSLGLAANLDENRPQLVGLEAINSKLVLPVGGQLIASIGNPTDAQGYVTSSCLSPTLDRPVALGMLRKGRSRVGEMLFVYDERKTYPARVVRPAFYDPDGLRLNE